MRTTRSLLRRAITGEGGLMKEESVIDNKNALSDKQGDVKDKPKDEPKLDSKIMIFNTKEK